MSSDPGPLPDVVRDATRRRRDHADRLLAVVPALGEACRDMAQRFRDGALLQPTGVGVSGIDAAHVAVEFIHPVITGKRALPALALDPAHVEDALPRSIVLGLRLGDDPRTRRAVAAAHARGCLAIDLTASGDGAPVDHVLSLDTADPLVARELEVTAYHLLWEIVHEHLDAAPAPTGTEDGLGSLYPFLDDTGSEHTGPSSPVDVDLSESIVSKVHEIGRLRSDVLDTHAAELVAVAQVVAGAGTVWTFGNGGSCTDASAVAHLLRDRDLPGAPIRAHALSDDVATITALTNDVRFDVVFARMLRTLAQPDDVAVGFSTSGNSANVLEGLAAARDLGCTTVAFAGYDGGELAHLDGLDHLFVVPSTSVHRIQEAQTTLAHVLVELVRAQGAGGQ